MPIVKCTKLKNLPAIENIQNKIEGALEKVEPTVRLCYSVGAASRGAASVVGSSAQVSSSFGTDS